MVRFFYKCLETAPEKDLSFYIKNYGIEALTLGIEDGAALLKEAYRQYRDERYWSLYCQLYPKMTEETFMTFEDFKGSQQKTKQPKRTAAEILTATAKMYNENFVR